MKHFKKYLPILIIISLSSASWYLGLYKYFSFDSLKEHQHFLDRFIAINYSLAVLIFCASYITIVSLSIPGATIMTIIGGLLFGQLIATFSAVISATIGGSILFLSAKMASGELLSNRNNKWVKKMQKGFQEDAFFYLLTLRLMPFFPFFAINLASAICQIPLYIFFFGTLIGIIPGSFVFVSMGVALREVIQKPDFSVTIMLDPKIFIALAGLGILSLMPVLYKYFRKK